MTRGLGTLRGSFKSSKSRLEGSDTVLDVGHGVVPQEAQDGLLSGLIGIGCDGSTPSGRKNLGPPSGDELLGDAGGLFALRSKRRDLPDEGDQMLAEAKVGGGGKCLLKFRNSGIDGGVEEWLKLFIGLSIMGLELWISIGFEIFGELEEDKEAPLEVLSSDPRLMWIVLLSESAK